MTSSHKGIIRGAAVDGVTFCSPQGQLESKKDVDRAEANNLKALEDFWLSKGKQEGREEAYQQGYHKGQDEGISKGRQEGFETGREEGDSAGYQRGLTEGHEQARMDFEESASLLSNALDSLGSARENLVEESRSELIRFCMVVCECILQRELSNKEAMEELIQRLLLHVKPIAKKGQVEVYLSRADKEMLEGHLQSLSKVGTLGDRLEFICDESLSAANCRVETATGLLQFSIPRQLQELEKKVLEVAEADVEGGIDEPEPTSGN